MSMLIGNSFPMGLIVRPVSIIPQNMENFLDLLRQEELYSFWGHRNTLNAVNAMLQADLTPQRERPVLRLDADGFPEFEGKSFRECWLMTPEYGPGFRPGIGTEVSPENISGWHILKMTWL